MGMLIFAVFLFVFHIIYNHFGHGITSAFMDLAFVVPLAGAAFYLILSLLRRTLSPFTENAVYGSVAAFSVGFVLQGIFEIAGTSSGYTVLFFIAGGVMAAAAAAGAIVTGRRSGA